MTYASFLESRFSRCAERLGLSAGARQALYALASLDLEPQAGGGDAHGRQGVLGWDRLFGHLQDEGYDGETIESAVNELAEWRVAQVVGREASDPVVSGPAAIRLTPEGRACVGLAPLAAVEHREDDRSGWLVLHGASRERLMNEAFGEVGSRAWRPVVAQSGIEGLGRVAGAVAASLCAAGCAVVDATTLAEADRNAAVPELLRRTRRGTGLRVLLLPDPVAARPAALAGGVRLRWVEPRSTDSAVGLDAELSHALVDGAGATLADVCGVPGTAIALPRKVDISFDDIVVPDGVRNQLEQVKMHARFRLEVLPRRKQFRGRGGGYRLLLSGLPGTGKSMTAEALATDLGRSIVKLDLSSVLSKWLGETEQLIGQVFDLAESAESVLVLDEAEALFRQRQSGSSGGNALSTAVAYLLTRLERYRGVLCATTNRTQDVDEAFFRRFNDYVILPMPDPPARRRLWDAMLRCGDEVDLDGLDIDLDTLAERFTVSGGLIRGASIRANAWAEGLDRPLDMPIVLAALGRELEKSDRSAKEVYLRPYAAQVSEYLQLDHHRGNP